MYIVLTEYTKSLRFRVFLTRFYTYIFGELVSHDKSLLLKLLKTCKLTIAFGCSFPDILFCFQLLIAEIVLRRNTILLCNEKKNYY